MVQVLVSHPYFFADDFLILCDVSVSQYRELKDNRLILRSLQFCLTQVHLK